MERSPGLLSMVNETHRWTERDDSGLLANIDITYEPRSRRLCITLADLDNVEYGLFVDGAKWMVKNIRWTML